MINGIVSGVQIGVSQVVELGLLSFAQGSAMRAAILVERLNLANPGADRILDGLREAIQGVDEEVAERFAKSVERLKDLKERLPYEVEMHRLSQQTLADHLEGVEERWALVRGGLENQARRFSQGIVGTSFRNEFAASVEEFSPLKGEAILISSIDIPATREIANESEKVARPFSEQVLERVIRVFRDQFGLNRSEWSALLSRMVEAGYSPEFWDKVSDTSHNSLASEAVQRHLPEAGHKRKIGILLHNPLFLSGDLAQVTGLPSRGEFELLVQNLFLRSWNLLEDLKVNDIHKVHAMVFMSEAIRSAYCGNGLKMTHLLEVCQAEIGRAVKTLRLFNNLPPEVKKELEERWGRQILRVLLAVEGKEERISRLLELSLERLNEVFQQARESGFQFPKSSLDRLSGAQNWLRWQLTQHHVKLEIIRSFLDGLDISDEGERPELFDRIQKRLDSFEPISATAEEAPSSFAPLAFPVARRLPSKPIPAQITKAIQTLRQFGFQPQMIFELTLETQNRLIRGATYKALALKDGRIMTGLVVHESFSHLFFQLDRRIHAGTITKGGEVLLRERMSKELNSIAFEFYVDGEGVIHLSNRSGSYRTHWERMWEVASLFHGMGLKFLLSLAAQENGVFS